MNADKFRIEQIHFPRCPQHVIGIRTSKSGIVDYEKGCHVIPPYCILDTVDNWF